MHTKGYYAGFKYNPAIKATEQEIDNVDSFLSSLPIAATYSQAQEYVEQAKRQFPKFAKLVEFQVFEYHSYIAK